MEMKKKKASLELPPIAAGWAEFVNLIVFYRIGSTDNLENALPREPYRSRSPRHVLAPNTSHNRYVHTTLRIKLLISQILPSFASRDESTMEDDS